MREKKQIKECERERETSTCYQRSRSTGGEKPNEGVSVCVSTVHQKQQCCWHSNSLFNTMYPHRQMHYRWYIRYDPVSVCPQTFSKRKREEMEVSGVFKLDDISFWGGAQKKTISHALFHAITLNGDQRFQAWKGMQNHYKCSPYDLIRG